MLLVATQVLQRAGPAKHVEAGGEPRIVGIQPRTRGDLRNGALAALASQVPPALLADQIGLSPSGASNWSKATGAAMGEYVARRHD
ncbi:MAG TPA: hypothetical protein VFA46_03085 [Actinomycetes bacterium]|nr:hypothetical protein [Actinomycetes bacterium]